MTSSRFWVAVSAVVLLAACGSGPTISSFTADKSSVPYGGTVKLTWSVKDADSVSINGTALNGTSATDTPTATTSYVLTATNSHGSVSSPPVKVTVTAGMSVSGGTYNSGSLGTTYLVQMRDGNGQPQSSDTVVTISPPGGGTVSFTCSAGQTVCLYVDAAAPQAGAYVADATLGSDAISTNFAIDATSTMTVPQVTANLDMSTGNAIDSTWTSVTGAQLYVAQAYDLDTGNPISDVVNTTQTQARLTLTEALVADANYGVAVSAFAVNTLATTQPSVFPIPNGSRGLGYLQNVPGNHWSVYGPADYSGGSLTLTVPNLDPTEHLAILTYNLGTTDLDPTSGGTNVNISVSGVSPSVAPVNFLQAGAASGANSSPLVSPVSALRSPSGTGEISPSTWLARQKKALRAHELVRSREAKVLADLNRMRSQGKASPALAVSPSVKALRTAAATNTSFCVQQGIDPGAPHVRKDATLKKETAHALFYVDDQDLTEFSAYETGGTSDVWNQLGDLWESTIYPTDTGTFGAESDVDANGKLIIFISHELGSLNANGAITLGYYWAGDVVYSKDSSTSCTGTGGNAADMFYLNDLKNLADAGYSNAEAISTSYPDTLGHEFQHLINFNQKHIVRSQSGSEDTWINEGLSVTAEDLIGFGWNTASGRSEGNALLTDQPLGSGNPYLRYFNTSLFNWEGDPVGDYQGAHTFFRYFADRLGDSVLGTIVQTADVGTANLTNALGEPFDRAFGEWITALMFSNETFSPASRFDFTGTNWSPLHLALQASSGCSAAFPYPNRSGYLQYETFIGSNAQAALRSGGWNALVTNAGTGSPVTLTVTPTVSGVTPNVVVVRYSGILPDGRQAECPF